jgi:hypothetical protein
MLKKRFITTALAAVLFVTGWIAGIQIANAQSRDMLVERYAPLAGSEDKAKVLVDGLRDGTRFRIGDTQFAPPTGKMGYGNVDISLAIARAKLSAEGVASPTPEQLKGVLMGTSSAPGVLAMRASGEGWGQIAHTNGFKLGDVVRPDRPERPEKPERPHRAGR